MVSRLFELTAGGSHVSTWSLNPEQLDLPRSADVVVIGGGVNGAATAFNLARRGAGTVVLLERRQIGAGATGKSGALVRAHYSNVPEAALTQESLKIFWNWSEHVGFGDPGFEKVGFFRTVRPDDSEKLKANVAEQQAIGIGTRLVDALEASALEPLMFTGDIEWAAYEPDSGFADPNATTFAYIEGAIHFGALVATHTEAVALLTDEHGHISGVETNRGVIHTRHVVVAAGAWSDRLLGSIGLHLPLRPRYAQVVVFRWPIEKEQARKHAVVIDGMTHSWMRPEGANCSLIGVETDIGVDNPDELQETVDQDYIQTCRDALSYRFPVFAQATMRGNWRGVIMESKDHHPIIDKIDDRGGLFVMTGDNGSCFKTAPATGIVLAEWVLDGEPRLMDMSDFTAARFANGRPWVDEHAYNRNRETTISR